MVDLREIWYNKSMRGKRILHVLTPVIFVAGLQCFCCTPDSLADSTETSAHSCCPNEESSHPSIPLDTHSNCTHPLCAERFDAPRSLILHTHSQAENAITPLNIHALPPESYVYDWPRSNFPASELLAIRVFDEETGSLRARAPPYFM